MKNSLFLRLFSVLCVLTCFVALQGKKKGKKGQAKVIKGEMKKGAFRVKPHKFTDIPGNLKGATTYVLSRGNGQKPAPSYMVSAQKSGTVYLLVQDRGKVKIPKGWTKTKMTAKWGGGFKDFVYKQKVKAGESVKVPGHQGKAGSWYGVPNMLVVPQ